MTITITNDDIQNGRRCDPDCCPIGRALSRAGVDHFGVLNRAVMIADGQDHATSLPLPDQVKSWIISYDGNQPVEPISFELTVPDQSSAAH